MQTVTAAFCLRPSPSSPFAAGSFLHLPSAMLRLLVALILPAAPWACTVPPGWKVKPSTTSAGHGFGRAKAELVARARCWQGGIVVWDWEASCCGVGLGGVGLSEKMGSGVLGHVFGF